MALDIYCCELLRVRDLRAGSDGSMCNILVGVSEFNAPIRDFGSGIDPSSLEFSCAADDLMHVDPVKLEKYRGRVRPRNPSTSGQLVWLMTLRGTTLSMRHTCRLYVFESTLS